MRHLDPRQIIFDFDAPPPSTFIHADFGGRYCADIEVAPLSRGRWYSGHSCELGPENGYWAPKGSRGREWFPDHQSALRDAVWGIDQWIEMSRGYVKDPKRRRQRYPGLEKAEIWIVAFATRRGIDLLEGRRLHEEGVALLKAEAIRHREEYLMRKAA